MQAVGDCKGRAAGPPYTRWGMYARFVQVGDAWLARVEGIPQKGA